MTTPAYTHLLTERRGAVEHVTLNRPDVRNAFDDTLIADLTRWCESMARDEQVRLAIIGGAGKVFCAGADLTWMARMATFSREENISDAANAARLFRLLDTLPIPLIVRVHGAALGGGAGLAAVADITVAESAAVFGFTEVKLGIIPAVIAPFVLARIGTSACRELFVTGRRFDAEHARHIGLVHATADASALDAAVERYAAEILQAAPGAIAAAKHLLRDLAGRTANEAGPLTALAIADRRASKEGREGVAAFLGKRKPSWSEPQ